MSYDTPECRYKDGHPNVLDLAGPGEGVPGMFRLLWSFGTLNMIPALRGELANEIVAKD